MKHDGLPQEVTWELRVSPHGKPEPWAWACFIRGYGPVFAFLLLALPAWAEDFPQLISLNGPPIEANLLSLGKSTAEFVDAANQQRTVRLGNVVRWGSLASPSAPDQIVLADGSLLIGRVAAISRDELVVDSDEWGELTLPRKLIVAVIWQLPTGSLAQWRMRDELIALSTTQDQLLLTNGDQLLGSVVGGDNGEIRFQTSGGEVTLGTELVAGWRSTVRPQPFFQEHAAVGLRDGTKLMATDIKLADQLRVKLVAGITVTSLPEVRPVPERLIVYFRPANGNVRYLSDIKPLGHKHIPFVGNEVKWGWQADRNVLGGPLSSGDRFFEKGLGMHSTSRLAFDLDRSYDEFQAEICLDKSAGQRGSVVFRVFVSIDGLSWKAAFQSDVLRGGRSPIPVRVDIRSAKRIALVVDSADRGDVLDRANWIGARLVQQLNAD